MLLVAPPPILEQGCLAAMFTGGAAKSARFGELYGALARKHGLPVLDAGTVIRSSELDGVHYDAAEHRKLGRAMAEAATAMFARR